MAIDDARGGGWKKMKLNTVVRYRNRGIYDYKTVHDLIDSCMLLHVSFAASRSDGDETPAYPVILPMLGCTGVFPRPTEDDDDGSRFIYLHGYVSSRFFRTSAAATSQTTQTSNGVPICVSATHLDGIVMALTPNHHSCNYRSVVAYGHAEIVEDEDERLYAMQLITDNLVPGRWHNTRYPSSTELKATGIIRVEIDSASAKVRTGTTGESRSDLQDEQVRNNVWAGVLPVHTVVGEPIPAPTNGFAGIPTYIDDWRIETTRQNEEYAYSAGMG